RRPQRGEARQVFLIRLSNSGYRHSGAREARTRNLEVHALVLRAIPERHSDTPPRSRGTPCPGDAAASPRKEERARGKPGAVAPARLVCSKCAKERTRAVHRYNRTHAGLPRAIGVNGCFVISSECRAC